MRSVLAAAQQFKTTDDDQQFLLITGPLIFNHNPDQQGRCLIAEIALDVTQRACVAQQAIGVSVRAMIAGDR